MAGFVGTLHVAVLETVTIGKVYFREVIVLVDVVVTVVVTLLGVIVTVLFAVAEAAVTVTAGSVVGLVSVIVVGKVVDGVITLVMLTRDR